MNNEDVVAVIIGVFLLILLGVSIVAYEVGKKVSLESIATEHQREAILNGHAYYDHDSQGYPIFTWEKVYIPEVR